MVTTSRQHYLDFDKYWLNVKFNMHLNYFDPMHTLFEGRQDAMEVHERERERERERFCLVVNQTQNVSF